MLTFITPSGIALHKQFEAITINIAKDNATNQVAKLEFSIDYLLAGQWLSIDGIRLTAVDTFDTNNASAGLFVTDALVVAATLVDAIAADGVLSTRYIATEGALQGVVNISARYVAEDCKIDFAHDTGMALTIIGTSAADSGNIFAGFDSVKVSAEFSKLNLTNYLATTTDPSEDDTFVGRISATNPTLPAVVFDINQDVQYVSSLFAYPMHRAGLAKVYSQFITNIGLRTTYTGLNAGLAVEERSESWPRLHVAQVMPILATEVPILPFPTEDNGNTVFRWLVVQKMLYVQSGAWGHALGFMFPGILPNQSESTAYTPIVTYGLAPDAYQQSFPIIPVKTAGIGFWSINVEDDVLALAADDGYVQASFSFDTADADATAFGFSEDTEVRIWSEATPHIWESNTLLVVNKYGVTEPVYMPWGFIHTASGGIVLHLVSYTAEQALALYELLAEAKMAMMIDATASITHNYDSQTSYTHAVKDVVLDYISDQPTISFSLSVYESPYSV